jgi:hypothetical protein
MKQVTGIITQPLNDQTGEIVAQGETDSIGSLE